LPWGCGRLRRASPGHTHRVRTFLTAVFVAALVNVAGASTTPLSTGLYGHVTKGPISPVCTAEQPCSEPAAGVTLRFLRSAKIVAATRVRADGSYSVALPIGVYTVASTSRGRISPSTVRVRTGARSRRDFSIDTGIR
jgi:hypothetical protein